ncbi:methyltransferase domain-containing protein [Bacteroidales bacterium AH-315-N07]|nr:methyltransferase domain-containing protein [Bacteroidales bacterium AH-315-N07]
MYEFRPGDVIADIGSGDNAFFTRHLVLLHDSLVIYAQEIESGYVDIMREAVQQFASLRKTPNSNVVEYVFGTEKYTNLPKSTFDKVIIRKTFHHFEFMDEMLTDIRQIMKDNGKLYIFDPIEDLQEDHPIYTRDTILTSLQRNFFTLKRENEECGYFHGIKVPFKMYIFEKNEI